MVRRPSLGRYHDPILRLQDPSYSPDSLIQPSHSLCSNDIIPWKCIRKHKCGQAADVTSSKTDWCIPGRPKKLSGGGSRVRGISRFVLTLSLYKTSAIGFLLCVMRWQNTVEGESPRSDLSRIGSSFLACRVRGEAVQAEAAEMKRPADLYTKAGQREQRTRLIIGHPTPPNSSVPLFSSPICAQQSDNSAVCRRQPFSHLKSV